MRTLGTPPPAIFDAAGVAQFGSYRGSLPRIDFSPLDRGRLSRLAHHKRWAYAAVTTDALFVGAAIVDLGYASNAFAFAYDVGAGVMLADESLLGPPLGAHVGDLPAEGLDARFLVPGASLRLRRPTGASAYWLELDAKAVSVSARLDAARAPSGIAVVCPIPGGLVSTTEKRALLGATGEAVIRGKRFSLDGGLGGLDYTNGYLARHTSWRWAFALGRATSGQKVGLNLVQGFVGEGECALWLDDELVPLAEGRFEFDPGEPRAPWRIKTEDGSVDLLFLPGAAHVERKNLGLVTSRFIHPVGTYTGAIRVPGRAELRLDGVPGVAEDQDVMW